MPGRAARRRLVPQLATMARRADRAGRDAPRGRPSGARRRRGLERRPVHRAHLRVARRAVPGGDRWRPADAGRPTRRRSSRGSPARRTPIARRCSARSPRASGSSSGRPGPSRTTSRTRARWTTRRSVACAAASGCCSPASTTSCTSSSSTSCSIDSRRATMSLPAGPRRLLDLPRRPRSGSPGDPAPPARARVGSSPGLWQCVSGSLEAGERVAAGALRELAEETGLGPRRHRGLLRPRPRQPVPRTVDGRRS